MPQGFHIKQWLQDISHERLAHGFKTAFACLIGLFLTKALNIYPDPWLVITILVVMCAQLNVGSLIQKSSMRFFGTVSGSLIAAATIEWLDINSLTIAIMIALSSLFFSYLATGTSKWNEAGTLGAVTVTIILISHNPTLTTAFHRFIEISIGIVLAALVSQFILPVHARTHLRNSQAKTIRQLRDYYVKTLLKNHANYIGLDETLVKSLIAQRKLAADAAREPLGTSFSVGHFNQYLWYSREILRSISFMHQAYDTSNACKNVFYDITEFHESICNTLTQISDGIEKRNIDINMIPLPSLISLKKAMTQPDVAEQDMIPIHAFFFCAEILVKHIEKLLELVKEFNRN